MKKALFFLTISTFAGAGLSFLLQVILARELGPYSYGAFSSALTSVNLVAPLAGFGVGAFWLKVFGEEGWMGLRWVKPSLNFTTISLFLVFLLIIIWAFYIPHDELTLDLMLILSLMVVGQACVELVSSIFQLEEKYTQLALWQFLPHFLRVFFISIYIYSDLLSEDKAISVAIVFSFCSLILCLIGCYKVYCAYMGKISLVGHSQINHNKQFAPSAYSVFIEALPFGLAGMLYLLYFQSSVVIVKYLLGNEAAGQYSVMLTIMTAIYLFPSVIYNKLLLPKIHRWANQDTEKLFKVYKQGNYLMLCLGIVISGLTMFISPYLIPMLFGESYSTVSTLLWYTSIAIPFRFVASSFGAFLVTKQNMKKKVYAMAITAFISIILNVALISVYGLQGAALAVILVDVTLFLFYYILVKRLVFQN